MKRSKGIGTLLVAMLLVSMVLMPAVSAKKNTEEGDVGILATINLGSLFTDGKNNIATATGVGSVLAPAGYNTFTATWKNVNDVDNDGQGAIYKLTVWDANGAPHTTTHEVDRAGEGTISVSFNSQGTGDAQYQLYCETNTWFGAIEASDQYVGDLDYY